MENKFVSSTNVKVCIATIAFLAPIIGIYCPILINITEMRKDITKVIESVDSLCSRYDLHDSKIDSLETNFAVLKSEFKSSLEK